MLSVPVNVMAELMSYLTPAQSKELLLSHQELAQVLESEDTVYQVAMERGFPYFRGMGLAGLQLFESLSEKELLIEAGKLNDRRVIQYWHGLDDNRPPNERVYIDHPQTGNSNLNAVYVLRGASEAGHIELIQQILGLYPDIDTIIAIGSAVKSGQLATIEWYLQNYEITANQSQILLRMAVIYDRIKVVEKLIEIGAEVGRDIIASTIKSNNIPMFDALMSKSSLVNLLSYAVIGGTNQIVSHIFDKYELEPDTALSHLAIESRNLDIVHEVVGQYKPDLFRQTKDSLVSYAQRKQFNDAVKYIKSL